MQKILELSIAVPFTYYLNGLSHWKLHWQRSTHSNNQNVVRLQDLCYYRDRYKVHIQKRILFPVSHVACVKQLTIKRTSVIGHRHLAVTGYSGVSLVEPRVIEKLQGKSIIGSFVQSNTLWSLKTFAMVGVTFLD
jgi:hypothetical protein